MTLVGWWDIRTQLATYLPIFRIIRRQGDGKEQGFPEPSARLDHLSLG